MVNLEQEVIEPQQVLNKIKAWTKQGQMRLRIDKCKIMHMGAKNQGANYYYY